MLSLILIKLKNLILYNYNFTVISQIYILTTHKIQWHFSVTEFTDSTDITALSHILKNVNFCNQQTQSTDTAIQVYKDSNPCHVILLPMTPSSNDKIVCNIVSHTML